jgi:EAL domain-containing protein (putative c-di-GMP-specific phosphodiesterase class I)
MRKSDRSMGAALRAVPRHSPTLRPAPQTMPPRSGVRPAGVAADARPPAVLIACADDLLLRALGRVARLAGWSVVFALDVDDAMHVAVSGAVEVVFADMDLLASEAELLRRFGRCDPDLPILLFSADRRRGAAQAVDDGAYRVIITPLGDEFTTALDDAWRARKLAGLRREACSIFVGEGGPPPAEEELEAALDMLSVYLQPVVWASSRRICGYEAVLRCDHPRLHRPADLRRVATQLSRGWQLQRRFRGHIVAAVEAPAVAFVAVEPDDLDDHELETGPLREVADRVVLVIGDRATLGVPSSVGRRVTRLRDLGYRIALQSFGSGSAGLARIALLRPAFIKLPPALVQGADSDPRRRDLIRGMVELCGHGGPALIASGIETEEERAIVTELGCPLLHGSLFATKS